jgi:phage host-nuclease inhibitor protein Gam
MSEVATIIKSADQLKETVKRLYGCTTADQISKTFAKYDIKSPEDKKELLHRCMSIEEYYDSPHRELSAEDEYDYAVSVFLEGSWRLFANG